MKLQDIIDGGRTWLSSTPERALDCAYRAALKIQAIEDDHFQGRKVASESGEYSSSTIAFFQSDVNNYLNQIKLRLAEFRVSRSLLIFSDNRPISAQPVVTYDNVNESRQNFSIVDKLDFIDRVVSKYKNESVAAENVSEPQPNTNGTALKQARKEQPALVKSNQVKKKQVALSRNGKDTNTETISDKTSVLPRSFMRTLSRIRREIDPQAENTEEEVIRKFRRSRNKTAISIRFLLILIIVPLFTHQFTKTFFINPLVERYFNNHEQVLFINKDLEEEALIELQHFEENLHFKSLIGLAPPLSAEEIEIEVHHKAEEIAEEYRHYGVDAIGNVFADLFSFVAFVVIIFVCKKEILVFKSFLDEIVYGLSDSAKAFLIILVTDMFVGYHSPHGWEVILEGVSRHLGLPENRDFNFLFIATFPVILDTVLKYWIFRYLNRISPSSVATYKNMNE